MYDILIAANGINFVSNFAKNLPNLSKVGCRREDAVTEIGRGKGKSKIYHRIGYEGPKRGGGSDIALLFIEPRR
jgi:hypothetical protein